MSVVHTQMGTDECIIFLGSAHTEAALTEMDCAHCESMILALLCLWIAFFNKGGPPSSAPPFFTSEVSELIHILMKAVEELGLEWSAPEEPGSSRLDEWYLPVRANAPPARNPAHFYLKFTRTHQDVACPQFSAHSHCYFCHPHHC